MLRLSQLIVNRNHPEDGTIKKENCLLYLGRRLVNQKLLQHRIFLPGLAGDGDVIALREMYLKEIETIIADGVKRGFLTPNVCG